MARPITFIDETDPLGPPADSSTDTPLSAANLNLMQDGLALKPVIGTHAARIAATAQNGLLYKESDTNLVYLGNGTTWDIWKGEGIVRKTADETVNNSSTLQDDNHLFFPIEANEVWFGEALLRAQAASINADFKMTFTGPAGATGSWGLGASAGAWEMMGTSGTPAAVRALASAQGIGALAGEGVIYLAGWFINSSTAGNITLQWAQNTPTVEDNKLLANSFLRIRRLA